MDILYLVPEAAPPPARVESNRTDRQRRVERERRVTRDGGFGRSRGRRVRRDEAGVPSLRRGGRMAMMLFLPGLHGRNPKNAGSAASRGLRRVMDGSGHRDAHDARPVSSVHAFQLGERAGCASGVAHAARGPRSRGPDPRQKPRREGARKTRVERRREAGARGLVRIARRRGCVGPIRRLDDRTRSRRFHASRADPRGCPPLSRAPIVGDAHASSPGTAGSLPPSFVDRGSRDVVDARAASGSGWCDADTYRVWTSF